MTEYLPLRTDGSKAPAISGWNKPDYHCTKEEALAQSDRVGMRCDGIVAVDCDSIEAFSFWVDHVGGADNLGPVVKTPRGFHVYYDWSEGAPTGPAVGIFPNIDVRSGIGSYVVCPPTPGYMAQGRRWSRPSNPSWFPGEKPVSSSDSAEEGWEEIPEGRRNATLASVAGSMRKQGAAPGAIATFLHGLNNTFCHPPLPGDEIVAIAHSVARYEPDPDVKIIIEVLDDELGGEAREEIPDRFWAEQLVQYQMPEISWSIPGFIPEGVTLLVGRPKVGKSWFALGLAIAVAEGGTYLGEDVEQGKVLYLALEDNARRLKLRLEKVMDGRPMPPPEHLHFATVWPRLPAGVEGVVEWLQEHPETKLIIVDTLAKVRHEAGERSRGTYQDDYQALALLKRISDITGITIIVIHHQRKSEADDVLDTVSGTTGLTGAADTILVLSKDKLQGRGRDLERDIDQAVRFDEDTVCWYPTEAEAIIVCEAVADWVIEHGAPGDEVPSRDFLAGIGKWSQREVNSELKDMRLDPRFEAVHPTNPRSTLRIRSVVHGPDSEESVNNRRNAP